VKKRGKNRPIRKDSASAKEAVSKAIEKRAPCAGPKGKKCPMAAEGEKRKQPSEKRGRNPFGGKEKADGLLVQCGEKKRGNLTFLKKRGGVHPVSEKKRDLHCRKKGPLAGKKKMPHQLEKEGFDKEMERPVGVGKIPGPSGEKGRAAPPQ